MHLLFQRLEDLLVYRLQPFGGYAFLVLHDGQVLHICTGSGTMPVLHILGDGDYCAGGQLLEFPKVKDTTSIPRGLLLNRYSRRAG